MSSSYPQRRSLRLRDYDYVQAGAYFVTVCVQGKMCLLGDIVGDSMTVSAAGQMIQDVWNGMPQRHVGMETDAFVVMPSHFHGVIVLAPKGIDNARRLSISDVMQRFKSLTTALYRKGVKDGGWPAFPGTLWQRNYYEHVVRSDNELKRIRDYIANNPLQWALDRENPAHKT